MRYFKSSQTNSEPSSRKSTFVRVKDIFLLLLFCLPVLCACDRTSLYTKLNEREAVEMQAVLLNQGIDCDKISGKEETWELKVSKSQLSQAVEILKGLGYPRDEFTDLGELFPRKGLVSSPMEEKVRYLYGLSQEVSHTLSKIDGVITARVHIVLPENDSLSEFFQPSSASVFIKHHRTFDIQSQSSKIKQLIVNSVEGLNAEKVAIVPFAGNIVSVNHSKNVRILGIEVAGGYAARFKLLVFGLLFFLAVAVLAFGYLLTQKYRGQAPPKWESQRATPHYDKGFA